MGACASITSNSKTGKAIVGGSSKIRRPPTTSAKVVHVDGHVEEFGRPIQAKNIVSQDPNCFLCSSESMSIGTCVPQVPDDEELQQGTIYFMLPRSQSFLVLAICHNAAQSALEEVRSSEPMVTISNAEHEYLEAHNKARAAVGVEPLKWSEHLAKHASLMARYQRNNKDCKLANLTDHKYGANQLWESGAAETPLKAVETWVKEKE